MIKVEENEDYNGSEKKNIDGKKGWFVEKYDLIDKYTRRDQTCQELDDLSVSQFMKMFVPAHKKKLLKDKDVIDDVVADVEKSKSNLIML